jgi:mRNA interferase MazF
VSDAPQQYDVYWASLPAPVGRRPVLLLGRTSAYAYLARVLVAEVTTTVRGIPQEVRLGRREGLPRSCVANLDMLRTVPRACLTTRIGVVRYAKQLDIERALGHVLAWPELTSL